MSDRQAVQRAARPTSGLQFIGSSSRLACLIADQSDDRVDPRIHLLYMCQMSFQRLARRKFALAYQARHFNGAKPADLRWPVQGTDQRTIMSYIRGSLDVRLQSMNLDTNAGHYRWGRVLQGSLCR